MKLKEINVNYIYFFVGLLVGFFMCFMSVRFASASELDTNFLITSFPSDVGENNMVLYDTKTDSYTLISYDSGKPVISDNSIDLTNCSSVGGFYAWDKTYNMWVAYDYEIQKTYLINENQTLIYSNKNLYDEKGNCIFYKTSKIINNRVFFGINTVLTQKVHSTIKVLVAVGLVALCAFIGIGLIPKVIYKFL